MTNFEICQLLATPRLFEYIMQNPSVPYSVILFRNIFCSVRYTVIVPDVVYVSPRVRRIAMRQLAIHVQDGMDTREG